MCEVGCIMFSSGPNAMTYGHFQGNNLKISLKKVKRRDSEIVITF